MHESVFNPSDASRAENLKARLSPIFRGVFFALVVVNAFVPVMDHVDLGWHIAQGRWMLEHAAIYRQDALNYATAGRPVVDEYPLFQLVLFGAWSLGWWGPCLFTALLYLVLFDRLLRAEAALGLQRSSLLALSLALVLVYFAVATPLRPHAVTYLCVTLFGVFLLRHRETTHWTRFWPLAVLQVAWVNCHSGFVLGPAMVAGFGVEMVVRRYFRQPALAATALHCWLPAFLLVLLACFVNPYGIARFEPVVAQTKFEAVRAYVGEMEPLNAGAAHLYNLASFCALLIVAAAVILRRGAISYTFLLMGLFFYLEALGVKKSWPLAGLFLPLIVLSTGAFAHLTIVRRKRLGWLGVAGYLTAIVPLAMTLIARLDGGPGVSLAALWREYDAGRSELPVEACAWMKAHGVDGRLFHRCEDGGLLQQERLGPTFADTGFGKYDEAFIRVTGLVGDRPALLPRFLEQARPDFVVCGDFSFKWPFYLRQLGWRPIFYSPNSSVWARTGRRPDLPTVSDDAIDAQFRDDLAHHGRPQNPVLFGRNLIALQSLGREDEVFAQLAALPPELHRTGWYWEAARTICFEEPTASPAHRAQLLAEANALHADALTAEFRAYAADDASAYQILNTIPWRDLSDHEATLLLRLKLDRHDPDALALARRGDLFDLRNGRHWALRAEAEADAPHPDLAASTHAWERAVYYWPDAQDIVTSALLFADRTQNRALRAQVEADEQF